MTTGFKKVPIGDLLASLRNYGPQEQTDLKVWETTASGKDSRSESASAPRGAHSQALLGKEAQPGS